jgi:hypothetical protein
MCEFREEVMKRLIMLCAALASLGCAAERLTSALPVPTTVTWRSCPSPYEAIRWLAVQDGTGPWRRVAEVSGTYTFQVDSGRAGVAYVTGQFANETTVRYYTASELQALGPRCYGESASQSVLSGFVDGLARSDNVDIALAGSNGFASSDGGPGPWRYTLSDVRPGVADLLAVRHLGGCANPNLCAAPTGMIMRRGVTVGGGATLPLLNFSAGGDAFPLATRELNVAGLVSGETVSVDEAFVTGTTTQPLALLSLPSVKSLGASFGTAYYGVPDARLIAGDEHRILLVARLAGLTREAMVIKSRIADTTVFMGDALSPVSVTTARSGGVALVTARLLRDAGMKTWLASFNRGNSFYYVRVSAGYLMGSEIVISVPDFSNVAGWQPAWGLQPGGSGTWSVGAANLDVGVLEALTFGTTPAYQASTRYGPVNL